MWFILFLFRTRYPSSQLLSDVFMIVIFFIAEEKEPPIDSDLIKFDTE